jgi:ATP-dependent exoDNAse (exonuclease V) beta subunit
MSAATVSALALIALMVFFIVESRPQKKTLSMLDLAEFKDLPGELRAMIRSVMPNGAQLKKHWAHMTPQQKQMVMQQISAQMPQQPQQDNRPPAPSVVVKPEPKEEPETPRGIKPGFLLSDGVNKSKKKNTKNKKHDEVVTLSDVGASEDEEPISTDITDADA